MHIIVDARVAAHAQVGEAWSRLAGLPPVSLLLARVQPSVEYTWAKYLAAHDAVVATPTYNKCVPILVSQGWEASSLTRTQCPCDWLWIPSRVS